MDQEEAEEKVEEEIKADGGEKSQGAAKRKNGGGYFLP